MYVVRSRTPLSCYVYMLTSILGQGLGILAKQHNLKSDRRDNRSMSVEDLKRQILTTLSTTDKSFRLGELRIMACLFLLLLAPAGARPASVLKLQYRHLQILLVRNPDEPDGRPKLVIRFTLAFTKKYLKRKPT